MPPHAFLTIEQHLQVKALNGGLFVSRGEGIHPRRIIDSTELILVRRGTLHIREESTDFAVEEGEALILRAGRLHEGTRPFSPDLSFYWLHFLLHGVDSDGARGTNGSLGMHQIAVPQCALLAEPDRLVELLRRFLDNQASRRSAPLEQDLLVMLMLSEVACAPRQKHRDASTGLANRAEKHLRTHFHKPISSATIARSLHCNADYLGRVYRAVYGLTLTQALHRYRLRHASRLLTESDLLIDQIAEQSGFSEAGYFRRVFGRHQGMSPRAYRHLHAQTHVNTL
jgi:AraC-like DNA-binding protein